MPTTFISDIFRLVVVLTTGGKGSFYAALRKTAFPDGYISAYNKKDFK